MSTVVVVGHVGVSLGVLPILDLHEIRNERWYLAFHHCRVSSDHVLVVGFRLVRLRNN